MIYIMIVYPIASPLLSAVLDFIAHGSKKNTSPLSIIAHDFILNYYYVSNINHYLTIINHDNHYFNYKSSIMIPMINPF